MNLSGSIDIDVSTGKYISKYNPQRTIDQFIKKIITERNINSKSIILIIGAIGVFFQNSLSKIGFDRSRIVICYLSKKHGTAPEASSWVFGNNMPFSTFLLNSISLKDITNLEIIEWLPVKKDFTKEVEHVHSHIKIFSEKIRSNIHTFGIMGKHWLKNFIRNYLSIDEFYNISSINGTVVLVVPGPSLVQSLEIIRKYRSNVCIAALSSAVFPLINADITPDLILQTDGGYWAERLLDYIDLKNTFIVKTFTSAISTPAKIVPLLNACPLEDFLTVSIKQDIPSIPDQGTVTVTALSYLSQIATDDIYVCGLDLENNIDSAHTNGHLQYFLWINSQFRTSSFFTKGIDNTLCRAEPNQHGNFSDRGLIQYAQVLSHIKLNPLQHVYRVCPSSINLPFQPKSIQDLEDDIKIPHPYLLRTRCSNNDFQSKKQFLDNLSNLQSTATIKSNIEEFILWAKTETYLKKTNIDIDLFNDICKPFLSLGNELLQSQY